MLEGERGMDRERRSPPSVCLCFISISPCGTSGALNPPRVQSLILFSSCFLTGLRIGKGTRVSVHIFVCGEVQLSRLGRPWLDRGCMASLARLCPTDVSRRERERERSIDDQEVTEGR